VTRLPIRLDGARRILLVKPSALGDVVHTLPVVATLHRRYPTLLLDWLVEEAAAPLVQGHPAVTEVVVSGRRRWLDQLRRRREIRATLREIAAFRRVLSRRRYDAVLDLQGLFKSAWYVLATQAPIRVGLADAREMSRWALTHRVPVPPQPVHAVERYLALAAAVDAAESVREFTIPIGPQDLKIAEDLLADCPRPRVVLHPATRWPTKLWEVERWRRLAGSLAADRMAVILTGSVADERMVGEIAQGMRPSLRSLVGKLSLKQLAAVLGAADLMITVDSGPMHIAAAMGTPVVALFGPTDPARTGPLGPGVVLRKPLPCSPCLRQKCRIADTHRCMRDLEVEEVVCAAQGLLAARAGER
jgi:heptosyltransferase I